ncbi:MAG: hypothetical protein KAV25_08130 [Methanophagales archaeon]|nr:hypothetical protein [Methanophagales archaeon]
MRSLFVEAVLRNLEMGREKEPFIRYIKEKADMKISLSQVRQELSSIKDNLSETISKQREERGHIDESLKENDIPSGTPVE